MAISRNRLRARQARLLDRLERRFRNRIRSEIVRASKDILRRYQWTGEIVSDREHRARIEAIYLDMARTSIAQVQPIFEAQFKAAGLVYETKQEPSQIEQWAIEFILAEIMRQRITDVSETTRSTIASIVAQGFRDGLGQNEIADLIVERLPELSTRRAGVIARTETHAAANYGTQKLAKQSNAPMRKVWLSGGDERVRRIPRDGFDHTVMDGVEVGLDDDFAVPSRSGGTDLIQYPGDPAGAAGNVINCRCSIAHEVVLDFPEDDMFAGLE